MGFLGLKWKLRRNFLKKNLRSNYTRLEKEKQIWKAFPCNTFTVMTCNWPAVRLLNKHEEDLDAIVKCLASNRVQKIIVQSHISANIWVLTAKRSRNFKVMELLSWTIVFLVRLNYVLSAAITKETDACRKLTFSSFLVGNWLCSQSLVQNIKHLPPEIEE